MLGYNIINLRDITDKIQIEEIKKIIATFSCPYNVDVENFLKFKAVEFSKQSISSTYLVFASYKKYPVLVGYFAIAQKYFHINLNQKGAIGSNLRRRIRKFAMYDDELQRHIVVSPLIGQLGKNYHNDYNTLITGSELLTIACNIVREGQRILGGKLVYLECEDVPSLLRFYRENGFIDFGKRELDGDERNQVKGQYLIQMLRYLE